MSQAPNKNPLKDRLNDDELDLSISNYKDRDVPVKEIALLKRATKLDLSNNKLTGLPKSFATLTHLVKLDLSCNLITELPSNFGELHRLRHLDLYNNQLSHLPLSFHQLASLRWLDLKNNELSPQLAEAAGECLNPRECELCARRVVAFMARVKEHYDQERIRRQQHEKELMSAKLAAEEAEKERLRLEKKAKKEQKKLELKARRKIENLSAHPQEEQPVKVASPVKAVHETTKHSGKSNWSFLAKLNLLLLLTTLAMATGVIYMHAHGDVSRSGLRAAADSMATNLATLAAISRRQAGASAESGLLILSRVSELGASAGDALVGRALAVYEWSGSRAAAADSYLTDNYGPSWKAVKSTAESAAVSAGQLARAAGEGALTLGDWAARRGWDLARTGAAAAWEASGPLWDTAVEHGTAVKAGVLAGAARLRQDAGPVLLEWAGSARDAAVDALWTLQREAPGYAAAGWAATCSAAAYTYDTLTSLVGSARQEAPSYASMAAEQFNRLLTWVTKG